MAISTLDEMAVRLEDLERDNRRLRLAAALVLGGAFLVAGFALVNRAPARRTVEAERLVIRDKAGRIRGSFGLAGDGLPGLILFDERGNEQVVLNVPSDGNSALTFSDKGALRMSLDSGFDGFSSLKFLDKQEKATSTIFMAPDSTAGLLMKNGEQGLTMGVQPNGQAAVFTTERGGRESGRVGAPDVTDAGLGFGSNPAGASTAAVASERPADSTSVLVGPRGPTKVSLRLVPPSLGRALAN